MAKYRLLTIEELQEMEKEFVDYLLLNGIYADDWVSIKSDDPEKAQKIIQLFSDVVFENIMRKTQFLKWTGEKKLEVLQCLKDRFVVVGLDASNIDTADFRDPQFVKNAMQKPPSKLEVFTSEILYTQSRELEIFDLTAKGFQICDDNLFKTLCLVLPQ